MIGLLLALLVTSLAVFERVAVVASAKLGFPFVGVLGALLAGWIVMLIVLVRTRATLLHVARGRPRTTVGLALGAWIISLALFAWVYPIVDSGRLGFQSDRDEAISVAVQALFRGEFPYACRAVSGIHDGCPDKGNPIGPWPGSFLLAAPVVWLFGSAGWLSLLSLPLAAWALGRNGRDPPGAIVALAGFLIAAPILPAEIITGGDLLANTILVLAPLLLLLPEPRRRGAGALAVLLGLAMSWRGLLFVMVPPVFASFLAGRRFADLARVGSIALAAFVAVTLPLYLWEPTGFTPWQVQQKLSLFTHILPHADRIFPLLGIVVGVVLGMRAKTAPGVLNACGWACLVPVLGAVVLNSIAEGHPTCGFYGWYALPALLAFAAASYGDGDCDHA